MKTGAKNIHWIAVAAFGVLAAMAAPAEPRAGGSVGRA